MGRILPRLARGAHCRRIVAFRVLSSIACGRGRRCLRCKEVLQSGRCSPRSEGRCVYRSKLRPPRVVLVWLYVERRLSDEQIGELCDGVSPNTVANWRRRLDVHRKRKALPPISKAALEDLYVAQGLTIKQVGEKVGRSAWTVHQALRAYKIPIRPRGHGPSPRRLPPGRIPDDEELARIYDAGHGLAELARRYGVSASTIRERAIAGGATIRRPGPRMPPTRARAPRPVVALDGAVLPGRGTPR